MRMHSLPGLAAAVTGAAIFTAGAVASAGAGLVPAVQPSSHPSAGVLAQARTALVRYLSRDHPGAQFVHPAGARAAARGTTAVGSYNWSGYADVSTTSGTFTSVSASWTVPSVTCTAEDNLTSEWVGLDGVTDATVEQDGTLGCCYRGAPSYFTWYEMYPAGTVAVGAALKPADRISASVTRSGSSYTLALTDATNSASSFIRAANCATTTCKATSAEWIAERPAFSIGIAPLASYSNWTLSNGAQTATGRPGTIGSFSPNYAITMMDATQSYPLSSVTPLTGGGSFGTSWRNSY
jgi:Peptidase A4 family